MNHTEPVLSGPVAVRQYPGWYATGCGCGCPIWKQKTGLNRTLKHYSLLMAEASTVTKEMNADVTPALYISLNIVEYGDDELTEPVGTV
jgi:hypothetical protein